MAAEIETDEKEAFDLRKFNNCENGPFTKMEFPT
jgi:hypothetical protein